jgi:hypothetical protein
MGSSEHFQPLPNETGRYPIFYQLVKFTPRNLDDSTDDGSNFCRKLRFQPTHEAPILPLGQRKPAQDRPENQARIEWQNKTPLAT